MIPEFIVKHSGNGEPIGYEWSDWDPYEPIAASDDKTIDYLRRVSLKGALAFVVGCLQWVVCRCTYDPKYRLPYEYIEAFSVYLAGVDSAFPDEITDDDRWEGPLDGPVNLAIGRFYVTAQTYELGGSANEAAFAAQIALHVLPDQDPFLRWQSLILQRLAEFAPAAPAHAPSVPMAPEILDPEREYLQDASASQIKAMLAGLDVESNRFLRIIHNDINAYAARL